MGRIFRRNTVGRWYKILTRGEISPGAGHKEEAQFPEGGPPGGKRCGPHKERTWRGGNHRGDCASHGVGGREQNHARGEISTQGGIHPGGGASDFIRRALGVERPAERISTRMPRRGREISSAEEHFGGETPPNVVQNDARGDVRSQRCELMGERNGVCRRDQN